MRVHISLDEDLVAELDARVGVRRRSPFIAASIRKALDDERRWDGILDSLGSLSGGGDAWDPDPAGWVREQRRQDVARVG